MKFYSSLIIEKSLALAGLLLIFSYNTVIAQCNPENDSLVLVTLYNETGGENWELYQNWLGAGIPLGDWEGVTINEEGCVVELNMPGILDVGLMGMEGELPDEMGELTMLRVLNLPENTLSGNFPVQLLNLDSLNTLILSSNSFSGAIPPEIGDFQNLEILGLGSNNFSGAIPLQVANLSGLTHLGLQSNSLTGEIPPEIGELTDLEVLDLSDNNLTGEIPPELGNLSNLRDLILSRMALEGSIPLELNNLDSLRNLYLNQNFLIGNVPVDFPEMRKFVIDHNMLTGELPPELGEMEHLQTVFFHNNLFYGCFPITYESLCDNFNVDFSENPGLPYNGDIFHFCNDNSGSCGGIITGNIVLDQNQNCEDDVEQGLQQWVVKAVSASGAFFGISDDEGNYNIPVPQGNYSVELVPQNPYFSENCTGIGSATIQEEAAIDTVNFYPEILIECPFLRVDISTPFLRRCFDNIYSVNYCNTGTQIAEGVYVEVTFDELIEYDYASIEVSNQIGNTFIFEIGEVGVNECGSFLIHVNVDCEAVLGQTLCAEVNIFPDTNCVAPSSEWSGAEVEIQGDCNDDEVKFIIKNNGVGDMLMDETYIVIEDGIILFSEPVPFNLTSGEDLELTFPANGSTYICQATQVDNYPGISTPIEFVEACGVNEVGTFSTGYATQYSEDDNNPTFSIDCQEVIGAFDPNDKRGFPKGIGESFIIQRGQDIEYHIRFQNTGTDTAFTVIIEDDISPHLDLATLKLGASSHNYELDIIEGDKLRFVFENIRLVDSFANEPASHGFLKFKIDQKAALPLGTVIENEAGIFFDFNEPVITNTTNHTIGEPAFIYDPVDEVLLSDVEIKVMPNPMEKEARIILEGEPLQNAQFVLYNAFGSLERTVKFTGNELLLKKKRLAAGVYYFEIIENGLRIGFSKLLIQ